MKPASILFLVFLCGVVLANRVAAAVHLVVSRLLMSTIVCRVPATAVARTSG
jgi:hypothetical protein